MGDVLPFLAPFFFPIAFGVVMSLIGVVLERRDEAALVSKEAEIGHFLILDTKAIPPAMVPTTGALVSGNAVLGTGYLKQLFASFRAVFGGEIQSYQRVLDRARRLATVRMIDEARAQGGSAIINVRYETSDILSLIHI